jgi:hypothetical protein
MMAFGRVYFNLWERSKIIIMNNLGLLVGTLMQSRNQAHIYHLQVKPVLGSQAAHLALQAYYEGIIPLIDGLVESYQGKYGLLQGYKMAGDLKEDDNFIPYFEALAKFVENIRESLPQDSYLVNQYDEICTLIYETKYKLNFLK